MEKYKKLNHELSLEVQHLKINIATYQKRLLHTEEQLLEEHRLRIEQQDKFLSLLTKNFRDLLNEIDPSVDSTQLLRNEIQGKNVNEIQKKGNCIEENHDPLWKKLHGRVGAILNSKIAPSKIKPVPIVKINRKNKKNENNFGKKTTCATPQLKRITEDDAEDETVSTLQTNKIVSVVPNLKKPVESITNYNENQSKSPRMVQLVVKGNEQPRNLRNESIEVVRLVSSHVIDDFVKEEPADVSIEPTPKREDRKFNETNWATSPRYAKTKYPLKILRVNNCSTIDEEDLIECDEIMEKYDANGFSTVTRKNKTKPDVKQKGNETPLNATRKRYKKMAKKKKET